MKCFFQVFQVFGGDGGIAGNDIVYNAGAFEKLCDDNRCIQVVIHCFVAFSAQFFHVDSLWSCRWGSYLIQCVNGFHQTLQAFFGCLQCFIAKVYRAAVMSLQDEETDCHWCIGLRQQLMSTGEEFVQSDEVAKWFTHLGSVDGNHVVVHPVVNHVIALWSYRLCDFTFVVRENQVHSSSVNIEVFTQVFASHSSTFGVPSGETVAPWRRPAHDMFRLCLFPKGEVGGIAFFALSVEVTGGI